MTAHLENKIRIPFHFSPYELNSGSNAVEKSDDKGIKRRYLEGVTSGPQWDQHKERMTEHCIKKFMEQANSGDVLLYPDVHGIRSTQDIGILCSADILANGDWHTVYRLYDEYDDVDSVAKEIANKLWLQVNGLPPYKHLRQKGFSIEGFIPDGAILQAQKDENGNLTQRVIDDVLLDGVVVVPRPAYKDSIANAVYKALGEMNPMHVEKVLAIAKGEFSKALENKKIENEYFKRKWELADALERSIESVMSGDHPAKDQELDVIFDEYKRTTIPLILASESRFQDEASEDKPGPYGSSISKASKVDVLKSMLCELEKLSKIHR